MLSFTITFYFHASLHSVIIQWFLNKATTSGLMYTSVQSNNINWLSKPMQQRPLGSYRGWIFFSVATLSDNVAHQPASYVGIMCSICIYWCILWKTYPLWLRSFLLWYYYWILFHWLSFLIHFWDIAIDRAKLSPWARKFIWT